MAASGKVILITGSTDGVGRLVATELASGGAHVLIHGRDRERAEQVLADIKHAGGTAKFYPADLSSLAEVRGLAEEMRRDHEGLDALINNAGVGTGGQRKTTVDGYELRFAVNYLSGFLLTRLLLPLLQARRTARIVNVSSVGQQVIDFEDVMLMRGYSGQRAYCQSKLAQIMFTFDLAQELQDSGVTANCLHPASYMDTTMVRAEGISPMSTVDEGAQAILNLAVSAATERSTGLYFNGLVASRANAQAYDLVARERLRTLSFELAKLPPASLRKRE